MTRGRLVATLTAALACVLTSGSCALIGRRCLAQQHTGHVAAFDGRVEAAQVVSRLVTYDQQGSQNNLQITWPDQRAAGGPRLRIYATSARCAAFTPPPPADADGRTPAPPGSRGENDPCAVMSGGGGLIPPSGEHVHTGVTVTGGPSQAKPDFHEYMIHIVGDPRVATSYSIAITWFFGPDC